LEKIQSNIEASKVALGSHSKHVVELQDMIKAQPDGPAKKELSKVLANAQKHV
jgi:hypothetical protein